MADAAPAPTSGDRPLRLITWNVNGLASHCRGGGGRSLAALVAGLDRAGGDGTPVDVVCVQETKLRRCELTADLGQLPGWNAYFCCNREEGGKAYAGVATFCRSSATVPVHAEEGFTGLLAAPKDEVRFGTGPGPDSLWHGFTWEQLEALDREGRVIITDHRAFVLINVYGPSVTAGGRGGKGASSPEELLARAEERQAFKLEFYRGLERRMRALLAAGRNVVLVGDLNISYSLGDACHTDQGDFDANRADRVWLRGHLRRPPRALAEAAAAAATWRGLTAAPDEQQRPAQARQQPQAANQRAPGQQRPAGPSQQGQHLQPLGLVDVFRAFHPARADAFTCWRTDTGARANNWGSRIDHILAAEGFRAEAAGFQAGAEPQPERIQPLPLQLPSQPQHGSEQQEPGNRQQQHQQQGPDLGEQQAQEEEGFLSCFVWSDIWPSVMGSDHCPVAADVRVPPALLGASGEPPRVPCSTHWLFRKQSSLKDWFRQGSGRAGAQRQGSGGSSAAGDDSVSGQCPQARAQPSLLLGPINSQSMTRTAPVGGSQSSAARSGGSKRHRSAAAPGSAPQGQKAISSYFVGKSGPKGSTFASPAPEASLPQRAASSGAENAPPATVASSAHHHHQQQQQQHMALDSTEQHQHQHQQQQHQTGQQQAEGQQTEGQQAEGQQAEGQQVEQRSNQEQHAEHAEQQREQQKGAAAAAWRDIMAQVTRKPRCKGHNEECVVRTVKKDGPTKGRQFYVCARAAGPPGVGRCDCFLWASNWDTKTGTVKKTTGGAGSGAGANSGAGATSGGAKKARRS